MNIVDILNSTSEQSKVMQLKQKRINVPQWSKILQDYEPTLHKIVNDRVSRKDKVRKSDSQIERASRIHVGLEQLVTKRMTEFTFAIPPKRIYKNADENDVRQQIVSAIESIYNVARVNSLNIKRGVPYFASCEICTIWYVQESPNSLYGFDSKYKLKCANYSPMDGTALYPLFDDLGDLVAMSFEYERDVFDDKIKYFETYTADRHIKWECKGGEYRVLTDEALALGKIPCIYMHRPVPIFHGLSHIREEIEYTLSRNSDAVAYNSAPILKVVGQNIKGAEDKGEARRVIRVENGGDVSYVSWAQSTQAVQYHVEEMFSLFFKMAQMPDVSFEKMASLGNIGYDARKTLLTDAHLKVGDESGNILEFLDRELNVIKAFLKQMKPEWAKEIDSLDCEYRLCPFVQEDETGKVQRIMTANGGQPVISHLDSIRMSGYTTDAQATLDQINKEKAEAQQAQAASMFGAEYQ